MTFEQFLEEADQQLFNKLCNTLTTAFTVCYLPYQQRHNITNYAREHTKETAYLTELGTSQTLIFLHALYIKTRSE